MSSTSNRAPSRDPHTPVTKPYTYRFIYYRIGALSTGTTRHRLHYPRATVQEHTIALLCYAKDATGSMGVRRNIQHLPFHAVSQEQMGKCMIMAISCRVTEFQRIPRHTVTPCTFWCQRPRQYNCVALSFRFVRAVRAFEVHRRCT